MELIGHIGVDSGQVMIGDPCYLDDWGAGEFTEVMDKPDGKYVPRGTFDYNGACTATCSEKSVGVLSNRHGSGLAVVSATNFGDGQYPVFVERDHHGRPKRLIVDFDPTYECGECGERQVEVEGDTCESCQEQTCEACGSFDPSTEYLEAAQQSVCSICARDFEEEDED